jgi:hypothetical protein
VSGINPYQYLQQVSIRMAGLNLRTEIKEVLDEVEYLLEVIPPEMQENAEVIISQLRRKLASATYQ